MVRKVNLTILILLAFMANVRAETYFVSNSGSDDSSGTSEQAAFRTCSKLISEMSGGDTALFMGGVYSEQNGPNFGDKTCTLIIPARLSGTRGHPTLFKNAPGYDRPVFTGFGANGYNASCSTYAVSLEPTVSFVNLDSLYIKWAYRGILIWTGLIDTVRYCVACSTGAHLTGINNTGGILVINVNNTMDSLVVHDCVLFHNWEEPEGGPAHGNCGQFESYGLRYSRITNNILFDGPYSEGQIFIKGGTNHAVEIDNNIIYGGEPGGAGIQILGADSCVVHHNVIYNCSRGIDMRIYSQYPGENNYGQYYNNTIYNCSQWGMGYQCGGNGTYGGKDTHWWNNIVINAPYLLHKSPQFTITNDEKYLDYNCYWRNGSSIVSDWSGGTYTLPSLISTINIDSNSVNVNPVFADPANHDFHLTGNSPQALKTGGRGGIYETYMGALDPNVETFSISGTVTLSSGGGISGVALSGLPGNPHTDNSGNYSATVTSGWSGTVTPNLTGYTFSPTSRAYSGVNSDLIGQDYTALPDTDPPELNNIEELDITDRSARITWTTNEPATSQIAYGLGTPYSDSSDLDPALTSTHSVILNNLLADTLYHFQALSVDMMGNQGSSVDLTFRTLEPDTTPPVISNVDTSYVTSHGAVITWSTNEPATSQVDFGFTTAYGSSVYSNLLVSNHAIGLVNLTPDTLYHFRVRSSDASGNEAVSGDFQFHTDTLSISGWKIISIGAWDSVSGTYPGYSTNAINDSIIDPQGGISTTWASNESNSQPHWVKFGFENPVVAAGMVLYWAWNNYNSSWMCSQQYRIQYWDGGSFIDIDSVHNLTIDSVTTTWFNPVETDSVRYFQPLNMGPPNYPTIVWLTELELYGSLGIPAPEPVGTVILSDSSAMAVALPVDAQVPIFYEFALDIDSTYPNPQIEPPLVVDTVISTTYGGLSPEYTYYWKCRAIATDLSDTSAWSLSETFYLNVSNTLQASEVIPENLSTVNSNYQTFQIKFYPPSEYIYFELDASPDFSSPLASGPIGANSEGLATWQPDSSDISRELVGNGIYYWRASSDNANWSEYSFTVKLDIHAYPVPFRVSDGNSRITFTNLPDKSKITVATVSGSVVFTQSDVGPGEWAWNVRNNKGRELSSGVYLFAVDSPGGSGQGKIVVIR